MNTNTVSNGDQKPLTIDDVLEAVAQLDALGLEPIGQWMCQQGYDPALWTMYVPKTPAWTDLRVPLPSYVVIHPWVDRPIFVVNGLAEGWR